ncbi:DUF799 domain-containing protein [Pseudoalteromonas sp. SSDWG2]|uniref:DUF799 domain-containing protein n=1 Tax=Pseudoalteromonas sp. SSDWG2 TaxID=3139391 RepID=UPI003BAD133A
MNNIKLIFTAAAALLASGCVTTPPSHDYSNFREANPYSILVLPPINNSPEVIAGYSVMSQITAPIAEAGFYVFPVALVDQTFKSNGITVANDAQAVPIEKLREIFGADAAMYITIEEYGTSYVIISSETRVTASAQLIDLRDGKVLWEGRGTASSAENRGNSGGGLVGMLVEAAVSQIVETVSDAGFDVSAMTTNRMLSSESYNGLLYGPRSPKHGQPAPSEKQAK